MPGNGPDRKEKQNFRKLLITAVIKQKEVGSRNMNHLEYDLRKTGGVADMVMGDMPKVVGMVEGDMPKVEGKQMTDG